jgi:tol-pal system protein YbgF
MPTRVRPHAAAPGARRLVASLVGLGVLALAPGCASLAEHRKLEYEVNKLKRQTESVGPGDTAVADLRTDLQALRDQVAQLEGRIQETEHHAQQALEEARRARQSAAVPGAPASGTASGAPGGPLPGGPMPGEPGAAGPEGGAPAASEELAAYRRAYDAWRTDDHQVCIDRFREFLQAFPSSEYADDAAYWLADCHFKQGDYQTAILRFDDVVSRHPTSPKASEALFRQGEALMRLGPRYGKAAEKAFERVIDEYPDSTRARDAARQLELLGSG